MAIMYKCLTSWQSSDFPINTGWTVVIGSAFHLQCFHGQFAESARIFISDTFRQILFHYPSLYTWLTFVFASFVSSGRQKHELKLTFTDIAGSYNHQLLGKFAPEAPCSINKAGK